MDDNMNSGVKENGHHWGCMCGMCKGEMGGMHGWGHRHGPMHIIAKILVLLFVFWLGTQIGELHAYRGGMMGGYGGYYRGGGMMDGYGNYFYGNAGTPAGSTNATGGTTSTQ